MEISIDGYKISYKISGNGRTGRDGQPDTAVILQGWGTQMGLYDPVAAGLADSYRVVQLDLPGFGRSDEPREAWSVDDFADFFCKFMKEAGIGRAVLIGHSFGGRVIIKLAARDTLPFTVDRIVLIDSAGILPKKTFRQKFKIAKYKLLKKLILAKAFEFLFPDIVQDWKSRQGSADYRNATPIMRQCLVRSVNEDLTGLLSGIRQDTLLIWGDRDTATPIADAELMDRLIPSSGLVVLEGAGHFSFLEQPDKFRGALRSFLEA